MVDVTTLIATPKRLAVVLRKGQLSPQALGDWQKAEIAKWWPIIRAANVTVE